MTSGFQRHRHMTDEEFRDAVMARFDAQDEILAELRAVKLGFAILRWAAGLALTLAGIWYLVKDHMK